MRGQGSGQGLYVVLQNTSRGGSGVWISVGDRCWGPSALRKACRPRGQGAYRSLGVNTGVNTGVNIGVRRVGSRGSEAGFMVM